MNLVIVFNFFPVVLIVSQILLIYSDSDVNIFAIHFVSFVIPLPIKVQCFLGFTTIMYKRISLSF